jgi:hypothetical protein
MHPARRPKPDRSPEALAARLRALPQPPVPDGLEARLLAAIPAGRPVPRRHWAAWVGAVGALAAACLLAVLVWLGRDAVNPAPKPGTVEAARQDTPRPPDDRAGVPAWLVARRILDGAEPPPFTWPVPGSPPVTPSTAIPPDLLDGAGESNP